MAGDIAAEPTLKSTCINTISKNIHLFAAKPQPKSDRQCSSHADVGISGSTMSSMIIDKCEESMDCDDSTCLAALEIDSQKMKGDLPDSSSVVDNKLFYNIASLEEKCHHQPPCGSKRLQRAAGVTQTPHDDIFIPNPVSEELLKRVCKNNELNDVAAEWFSDPARFRIKRAYLKKAGHISLPGLRSLFSKHTLTEINAQNINESRGGATSPTIMPDRKRITVSDIIASMNAATKDALEIFNVSGVTSAREEMKPLSICVSFKRLNSLTNVRSLDVSHTSFTDNDLNTVIACMKNLRSLDISDTSVRSILYLGDVQAPKLHSLRMSNLDKLSMPKESLFDVFCKLTELRLLDISTEYVPPFNAFSAMAEQNSINTAISMVMVGGGHPLKNLTSLDISGRSCIEEVVFLNFYGNHPQLSFLGLVQTSLDTLPCFADEKSSLFNPLVKVAGDRTEAQIVESLRRYHKRPIFAKEALYSLFSHTHHTPQYNKEQLELVLRCMKNNRNPSGESYSVQLAASACVYNLTNRETGLTIHSSLLSQVVKETLSTMEEFQDKKQLQKNCLMTLCNDRILKDVAFDYFKTARLVMQCLCSSDDGAMHRMAVAIISILAAKISTNETAVLGSNENMKALLQIVERKLNAGVLDLTLKFALSALWNLTDESPSTCGNFIENNGLALVVRALEAHDDNPCVQTKVLGLLNNLAEVPGLRHFLLEHKITLIDTVRVLLHSEHIEVCYFAAGVVSHLAMLDQSDWDRMLHCHGMRDRCLDDLYNCVMKWEPPSGEMVAYRTFKPFFPLLQRHDTPAMQLWAAWAVRHVCLRNGGKYQDMLVKESGVECLESICRHDDLDLNVRRLVELTLRFVRMRGVHGYASAVSE